MTAADIQPEALKEWLSEAEADNPVYRAYPRCPKHKVFLSCLGCKICIEDVGKYPVEQEDPDQLKKFWYGTDAAPQGANTNEPNQ